MKSLSLLTILIIFTFALTACGGGETPAAGGDAGANTEAESAAEAETVTLSETVTSSDGVTVSYPAGWQEPIADIGIFVFNNERAPSGIISSRMDAGNVYVQITQTPLTRELPEQLNFALSAMQMEFSEPTAIEGSEGLMTIGTGENIEVLAAIIPVDEDTVLLFFGYTHPGELEANRALFMQMIDTLALEESA